MRLLFLTNLYPPHEIGGYEQWCQEVAVRLRAKGHSVSILTSRLRRVDLPDSEPDVIRTLHLQADLYQYRPIDFFLKRAGQERFNKRELRRVIDEINPELLVVWGMWNLSLNLPYWAEQWMPGRVAYFVSSYWPDDIDIHAEYWRLPGNRALTELCKKPARALAFAQLRREGYPPALAFEHAVCCSHYVRNTLVQAGKLPVQAAVLYGGIDTEPFIRHVEARERFQDNTLNLLFFGTLIPSKGVHVALEALGLLKQRGISEQVSLTILGSGHPDYEARLHTMVDTLGLQGNVHFVKRIPRDEIPLWLSRCDVFLFTSSWAEPMARTVMEAMAAGLLVIGSEVGGQVEMLVNGENALTFEAGDAVGLANQIAYVLDEPELRLRLVDAGRNQVLERFTLERMVDNMETWLGSIVQ